MSLRFLDQVAAEAGGPVPSGWAYAVCRLTPAAAAIRSIPAAGTAATAQHASPGSKRPHAPSDAPSTRNHDEPRPEAEALRKELAVDNVLEGFSKYQLPVYLTDSSFLFITVAAPGAASTTRSHDDGDGIRFIISGSIEYDGPNAKAELTAGDWMFVPKGAEYSVVTGAMGACMCYCYLCCCA